MSDLDKYIIELQGKVSQDITGNNQAKLNRALRYKQIKNENTKI